MTAPHSPGDAPDRNLGTLRFRGPTGFHQSNDAVIVDVTDLTVTQLRVDHAFSILMSDGPRSFLLRIEEEFDLALDGLPVQRFMSGDAPASELAPALALLHRSVTELIAHPDGRLIASFTGATLAVGAGEQYEAWQLNGPNDFLVVSIPDGGLSVWPETPRP